MQARQPNKLPSGMLPSILRVVFLSVFLASGQLAIFAGFFSNVASAASKQGAPHQSQHTVSKPLAHQLLGPDLGVSVTTGASSYNVGDTVSYTLTINNAANADPILLGVPITFTDLAALGLSNLSVTATSGWSFTVSSTTSPSLITGTYTGAYPIAAGQTLPTVTVTGTANGAVLGLLANVATVTVLGDLNLANNSATVDVSIVNAPTPTVVPTVTVPVPTVTATVAVPTVTATVAVPTVTATVAVPTVTATVAVPTVTDTVTVPTVTATVAVPTVTDTVTVPTLTVPVPSITATVPAPTLTPLSGPDLTIVQSTLGGTNFQVGQTVTYNIQVSTTDTSSTINGPLPITVTDVLPVGLDNISVSALFGWNLSASSTTGPALITGSYTGAFPILPGTALPIIQVTGTLDANAVPSLTASAILAVPGNIDLNTTAISTILVSAGATPTQTVTVPTLTATVPVPTITDTVTVPSVTATIPVPSVTSTIAVPSVTATATVPVPTITDTVTVPTLTTTVTVPTVTIPVPSVTSTIAVPSVTATVTAPYLVLNQTVPGGLNYQVGQTVNYSLQASLGALGGAETIPNSITVSEVLPLGLTNITTSGTGWTFVLSDTTGPAVLTAIYTGSYPIAVGTALPAINISGVLTADAVPSLTTSATISSIDNINLLNNTATATILVSTAGTATATVTVPTLTATVPVPSVTSTVTIPTLTTTVTVPTLTATIPVPSVTSTVVVPTVTTTVTVPTLTATIPVPSVTSTVTIPTVTVTVPVPSVTSTVTVPTVTATPTLPDVNITLTHQGGSLFQVGQSITYTIQVTNQLDSGNLARINSSIPLGVRSAKANTPIAVTAIFPLGLNNLVAAGSAWNISTSSTNGPALLTASYNGPYPVVPGQALPAITVTGTLTAAATPVYTPQATVVVPGNRSITTLGVDSVTVQTGSTPTATVTVPTATTTVTVPTLTIPVPSVTSTIVVPSVTTTVTVPTATTTVTVPTVTATIPVPSVTTTVTVPTVTTTVTVPTVTVTVPVPSVTATIPAPSVTATVTIPTATTTVTVPSPTSTVAPTATIVPNPDFSVSATVLGSTNATVGQIVVYSLQVSNSANAGAAIQPNSINLTDILPLGLNQVQVTGSGWQVSTSATVSPAVITATYIGNYPVQPGTTLPTLIVSGVLAPSAVPSFTTTASVNVPGDINYANNLATVTVLVSNGLTATPISTPTAVPTNTVIVPTVTTTVVPTVTVTVPTITATIPVPSVTATTTVTVPTITVTIPVPSVTATTTVTVPTITATIPVPSVTATTTVPTTTPTQGPDLGITQTIQGGTLVNIGHNAIFALGVSNSISAGAVTNPGSIIVSDVLPLGLDHVQAAGSNWIINVSATTSPTVITAVYNGVYPVLPGAILPPIIITGVLNGNAVPTFTSTASVNLPGDINYANNLAIATLAVNGALTPTVTVPTPTATIPTPTVTLPSHLMLNLSALGASNFTVGQNATYNLVVNNLANAGPVTAGSTVRVHDLLPLGLSNISASGNGWTITITNTTGPAMLTATYTSAVALQPGTALPPIVILATVNANAVPTLTNVATVSSTGNNNAANNTAILTLPVFRP